VSIQPKSITKEVYKLTSFEVYKIVDRLQDEFPHLETVAEMEENIHQREKLLGLI